MKNNVTWKVYKYTNKQNGMCYIGITSRTLKERAGKDICIKNKNENFSPMKLIDIFELSTVNINTGKLER